MLHTGNYSTILRIPADPLCSSGMWLQMNDCCFIQQVLYIHQSGSSAVLIVTRLVVSQTVSVSVQLLCTTYNHVPADSVTIWGPIRRVYVCLAVTCHDKTMHYLKDLPFKTNIKVSVSLRKTSSIYLQYQPKVQNSTKWMLCSKVWIWCKCSAKNTTKCLNCVMLLWSWTENGRNG